MTGYSDDFTQGEHDGANFMFKCQTYYNYDLFNFFISNYTNKTLFLSLYISQSNSLKPVVRPFVCPFVRPAKLRKKPPVGGLNFLVLKIMLNAWIDSDGFAQDNTAPRGVGRRN